MNDEPAIRLAQTQIAFLRTFELSIPDKTSQQTAVNQFIREGVNAFLEDKNLADFETAESFFYSAEARSEFFRIGLPGFKARLPRFFEKPSKVSELEANTILTVYPKYNVGVFLLNFYTEGFTVDEIIFLAQCVESRNFKLKGEAPDFVQLDSGEAYLEDVMQAYMKTTSSILDAKNPTLEASRSRCVEINGLVENLSIDPQKLYEEHPREIYGMITCDEGWRFVPETVAKEKTRTQWSTRDFLTTISLGISTLAIHCDKGERAEQYKDSQQSLRKAFGYPTEGYFAFEPRIAADRRTQPRPVINGRNCSDTFFLARPSPQENHGVGNQEHPVPVKPTGSPRRNLEQTPAVKNPGGGNPGTKRAGFDGRRAENIRGETTDRGCRTHLERAV